MEVTDATEQARRVRDGEVSGEELVESAIERIESVNDQLNAVVTTLYDRARRRAREDELKGPFAGVPFLIKDLIASYEGAPMSFGSELLSDFEPDHNSYLVDRYLDAG
ncbi:MAG: amidase family protein, partial [bacterium]